MSRTLGRRALTILRAPGLRPVTSVTFSHAEISPYCLIDLTHSAIWVKSYGRNAETGAKMITEELDRALFQHLPLAYAKRALQAVFAAHKIAWDECAAAYAETEAENVRPYAKRAKLEGYLRDIADLFEDVSAEVVRADGSNWNHTEVRAGPVVLTANSVQTPCALVEKAEFRLTLARDAQGVLFPDERLTESSPLYALLLHSKSRWDSVSDRRQFGHLPGSAYLAFPSADLNSYVHEINLFERFPDVVDAHLPKEWTEGARVAYKSDARKALVA